MTFTPCLSAKTKIRRRDPGGPTPRNSPVTLGIGRTPRPHADLKEF
jgi:hypothetical protein